MVSPEQRGQSFYIGQVYFPRGDSIEITSVERTETRMVVKGGYNLVSSDRATLALFITATTNQYALQETDAKQEMQISKGRGDFELVHPYPHLVPGSPHVSMYSPEGKCFATIYFGTKAQALESSKWDLRH